MIPNPMYDWKPTTENVEKLFKHMEHGDEKHREWLREHLYAYFGLVVPTDCKAGDS